jgi:OTU domain-containing protein 5
VNLLRLSNRKIDDVTKVYWFSECDPMFCFFLSCGRHKRHDHKRSEIRSDRTDKSSVVTSPTVKPCSNATQLINPSGGKSPKNTSQYLLGANSSPVAISSSTSTNNNGVNLGVSSACSQVSGSSGNVIEMLEEAFSGYNSGDEHMGQKESVLTPDQWEKRDKAFSKALTERGLILKDMVEDGACLFRAISIQLYGDQEMHETIRQQTMDYIVS